MSGPGPLPAGGLTLAVTAAAYGFLSPWLAGRLKGIAPARARSLAATAAGAVTLAAAFAVGVLSWHPALPGATMPALLVIGLALGCGEFAAAAFLTSVVADSVDALRGTRPVLAAARRMPRLRPAAAATRAPAAPARTRTAAGRTHWLSLARGHAAEEARARVAGPGPWGVVVLATAVLCDEAVFRAALTKALTEAGAVVAVGIAVLAQVAVVVHRTPAGRRRTPDAWVPALLVAAVHTVLYWRGATLVPLLAADAAFLALLVPAGSFRPTRTGASRSNRGEATVSRETSPRGNRRRPPVISKPD
ncbi:type II CAAX prenyl endopeptidase Rce1 family protein [Streptomyces sp. NPDC087300]|uniref:CPBP family glutamic-type intramembrane protease n=1 Tax=Streptomyces sp. NPDC087300 TaxID=3365780 RepID=UPI0037FF0AC4